METIFFSAGYVRGRKSATPKGVEGYVFLSVPIADPPVGPLRFKAPVPRTSWRGVLDTTDYTVSCYWNTSRTSYNAADFNMDEDCLQVHIFTNRFCLLSGGCSVAMYVHGGGFQFGSPLQFDENIIVENFNNASRNVIFVTVNVRQAVFGIFNLNWKLDLSMDMNVGLHDLVHSIKWIKSEIQAFGGDPNRLTLMGHSGGGALVKLLAMCPKSRDLVNQVISMSAGEELVLVHDKNQESSRQIAKVVGCASFDIEDEKWDNVEEVEKVLGCLRSKSGKELADTQKAIEPDFELLNIARDFGENALVADSLEVMEAEMNPIPVLVGTSSKEYLESKSTVVNGVQVDQTELRYWCQETLRFAGYIQPSNKVIIACMKEYNTTSRSMYIYDDPKFFVSARTFLERQTKRGGKGFLYEYSYPDIGGAYVRGPNMPPFTPDESPHHSQELAYILGQHLGTFTPKDDQVQFLLTQFFVDFMNQGTPGTEKRTWTEFDPEKGNYFDIDFPDPDLESPGMQSGYHQEGYDFWHVFIPTIAGPKFTPLFEADVFNEQSLGAEAEKISPKKNKPVDRASLNWELMFWIGAGVILLLIISLVLVCWKLQSKKSEYERL
ncbi:hypothetical protein FO519_004952 [Halicephalobus sp. NKZ332]|nr:hypothetical protein FO519_004952 [Halicephalobus sp. NKZ332]